MTPAEASATLEGLLERLAAIEHDRWAHWQRYLHSKCARQPDGGLLIPASLVAQWERQIDTSYGSLTESEKNSDREQVKKYLPIIEEALRSSADSRG